MNNYQKGILTAVLIMFLLAFGSGWYMIQYSLVPDNRGKDIEGSIKYIKETYPYVGSWLDSLEQERALLDTFIINKEGKKLHAYYVRAASPSKKTAVVVHGYTDNALRMMMIGYLYNHSLGYNVLLPDLQFHGKSEGDAIQMGWKDRLDVLEWIDLTKELFDQDNQTVVHGISMGAATTMMLSGEELPNSVKCLIEDCGYTTVWEQFEKELKERFGLPSFPILHTANMLCKLFYQWDFKTASAIDAVRKSTLPIFFIHGDADRYVPTEMVYPLYHAKSRGDKEIWIVPGAAHAVAFKENPKTYTQKVKEFTSRYIHED